tara:strand:+ start:1024 stop:1413 length:390 start_codon:yes stop_codon:yes gene_type:complete
MKVIKSRFNEEINLNEKTIDVLKSELKFRGLKLSGSKLELIKRIEDDDKRLAVSNAEQQLIQLNILKKRLDMKQGYYDLAVEQWEEQRIIMTELINRRTLCEEELAGAKLAMKSFRENLVLLGVDPLDF